MIKIAGGLPVKTRLPITAWALAGLVTLFSLVSSLMDVQTTSGQAISIAGQAVQPAKKSQQASVLGLLARVADVLASRG